MTINKVIDKAIKESNGKIPNLTRTIAYASQETYVKAMNDIYKQVGTGKIDHFTAYKKAVDELTKKGITLKAKDGREEKLEVAVRRGLFGSLHQTANDIAKQVGEDIDYNCVVIGHSSTCRPSHNVIDDVVMSKKEFEKYECLTKEYGCNHVVNYDWREEFEDVNKKKEYGPEHVSKKECAENYEIQQKARYFERIIREKKAIISRGDTSEKAKRELKLAQVKYRIHCGKYGLNVDYKRTWKSNATNNKQNPKMSYEDVTREWPKKATPNNHKVKDRQYFEYNGTKYKVDGKNVVLDYSEHEYEIAIWIENTFGGEIFMVPRVNKPNNISSPDYIWNNEKWDLKEITGESTRAIDNAIKRKKEQSTNFIIDITRNKLDEEFFLKQIEKIYSTPGREWVDKIILKRDNEVIAIYKRK